jgi:hypothetical protein
MEVMEACSRHLAMSHDFPPGGQQFSRPLVVATQPDGLNILLFLHVSVPLEDTFAKTFAIILGLLVGDLASEALPKACKAAPAGHHSLHF